MKRKYIKPQTISVATQAEGWLMAASNQTGGTDRRTNGNPPGTSNNIKSSSSTDLDWSQGQGPNGGTRAKGHYSSWNLWDE